MDQDLRALVVELLAANEVLTLATLREDGWPQANTLAYVNEGLTLYAATGADAAKVRNIRRDPRVSLTVDAGKTDWSGLRGVSMAAHAQVLDSRSEIQRVARLVKKRFPSLEEFSDPERDRGWAFLRLVPRVISVIDYTRGFGHSVLAKL
jgi:nitroimidazol reductase NimA-like FMN-containing flavoprotein (pyridoxamine 5'-phosphate oxidase superfamily)